MGHRTYWSSRDLCNYVRGYPFRFWQWLKGHILEVPRQMGTHAKPLCPRYQDASFWDLSYKRCHVDCSSQSTSLWAPTLSRTFCGCVGSGTTVQTEGTPCLCLAEQTPAGHLTELPANSGKISLPKPLDLVLGFFLKSLPQIQHIEHILRAPGNTPPSQLTPRHLSTHRLSQTILGQ